MELLRLLGGEGTLRRLSSGSVFAGARSLERGVYWFGVLQSSEPTGGQGSQAEFRLSLCRMITQAQSFAGARSLCVSLGEGDSLFYLAVLGALEGRGDQGIVIGTWCFSKQASRRLRVKALQGRGVPWPSTVARKGLWLSRSWLRRDSNQEADDLTNGEFGRFDLKLRIPVHLKDLDFCLNSLLELLLRFQDRRQGGGNQSGDWGMGDSGPPSWPQDCEVVFLGNFC